MIKTCNVISSISARSGGTSTYMQLLLNAIDNNCVAQNLVCFNSSDNLNINNEVKKVFVNKNKLSFFYSKPFVSAISNVNVDLFHGNGLWEFPVHAMSKLARQNAVPYVISTHGMLEPWALSQGKFKKQVALQLFQYKDLQQATCLHATAPMEVKSIRALGLKNPVAMIPNGINVNQFPVAIPVKATQPKRMLFLSRIHVKKGIENLIEAWQLADNKLKQDWVIDIYGNGEPEYIKSLKTKIKAANLEHQITIKPPVFDDQKTKVFREASVFVLPTFSENFGIVVAEALASYTPVITTKGAPWEELNTTNCGQWIGIGVAPLVDALNSMMAKSPEDLQQMGVNGRQLIEQKYSMQAVAKQMLALYDWILNKAETPDFIDIV